MRSEEPNKMSYETYAYLKGLLESEKTKLHDHFRIACGFFRQEDYKQGNEKAYNAYLDKCAVLTKMQKELRHAAAALYENHPNPEMKKFWELK